MNIREATIEDLASVVELFDKYRVWYRKSSDKPATMNFLRERINNKESVLLVIEISDMLVGFTQLYPIFSSVRLRRMWLLNDLYILPSHRGKGYSHKLIAAAKKYCVTTNACGILLETEISNTIGNKLYISEGFHLEENNFYFWTNKN